jgi:hypothetical protein
MLCARNVSRGDPARPRCQGLEWRHCGMTHHTLMSSACTSASGIGRGRLAIM